MSNLILLLICLQNFFFAENFFHIVINLFKFNFMKYLYDVVSCMILRFEIERILECIEFLVDDEIEQLKLENFGYSDD